MTNPTGHKHDDFTVENEPGEPLGAPAGTHTNGVLLGGVIAAGYDGCKPCQATALDQLAGDPLTVARLVAVAAAAIEHAVGGIPPALMNPATAQPFAALLNAGVNAGSSTGLYPAAAAMTPGELRQAADHAVDLIVGGLSVAAAENSDWADDAESVAAMLAAEDARHITATEHDGTPVWLLHVPLDAARRALHGQGLAAVFANAGVAGVGSSWAAPDTHEVVHAFSEASARQAFYALRASEVAVTPRPDAIVPVRVRLLGLANGTGTPFDGGYLAEYDPTRPAGPGQPLGALLKAHIVLTQDPAQARTLDLQEAAIWVRQPSGRTRPDGEDDRPITGFNTVYERVTPAGKRAGA